MAEAQANRSGPRIVDVLSQPAAPTAPSQGRAASGIIEVEAPDGSVVEFPSGTDRGVMTRAMQERFGTPANSAPESGSAPTQMIQIRAPDGGIVQFPGGTDDATIIGVMAKNYPAPTPDLATLGVAANRELAERPGAADARNASDLTALAPPASPQSFMDRLKTLVSGSSASSPAKPDQSERSLIAAIMDQGAYVPRGMRRGVANLAGLPVDLMNGAMSLAGANVSPKPFMGSKFLDDALGGFGVIPDVRPPATVTERALLRIGEEVGAAAVPVGGAIAKAGQVGVEGARKLPSLVRMFVEPAAINPTAFARKEGATAFAAGTGAAAANEVARAGGLNPEGGAYQTLDILGALGGAGALGASRVVAKPIKDVGQAVFARDKFSNNAVKENVVDRIVNNAEGLPKTEGQPIDTQPLVDTIMGGRRVDAVIPGFKDSLADRTGDSGLATLEYGRQSGQNAGDFVKRRSDNTNAVDAAMDANAPQGSPAALRSELELERTRRLTDANVQTRNATDDFERATQSLRPAMTGEGRGANIRSALETASDDARTLLRQAWEPLNTSNAQVDMAPLADRFGRVRDNLSTAEQERFQPNQTDIPQRLSGEREVTPAVTGPDGEIVTPAVTEPITQPIREVTGLRTALTDASREAATAGRDAEARVINQHVDALDLYLERAVPHELRTEYDAARAATVDYHDRFTRPQTAVAQTLDRQQGQYRQPDSAVAGKFVQADEGRINDFQALMRETGNDPRTVSAVRDQILADVRDRGLLDRPDQLQAYLGQYNTILSDPRFAATRGDLDNAAGLRRALEERTAAEATATRELGTPDRPGTSTVGKYLAYGDERSQDALKTIIGSKTPGAAMGEALDFVNNTPEAVNGARKSFWDLMQSKARSNGETTKTMDGKQPWMPNKLQNFLDDPANAAVAERLWRDNPEHVGNVRKIAEELQNVDLRTRGKAQNSSGTPQGISNVLTPETLQSRFYAYKRGQTSLGFMLTALGSVAARRVVRGAQGEAMEKLLDKALLDPDLAAQLLKEHNPANRAALARSAKAYLGNEASTLMDILDGQEKDPVKEAIFR